jgi:hypothetical protein
MSCPTTRSTAPSITARPSAEEKVRFASVAAARGMSEAALALSAIRAAIGTGSASSCEPQLGDARVSATDRITIRLRPGDGEWITHRAAQRGMKRSAYLSALVRVHPTRSDSERHRGTPRNSLSLRYILACLGAWLCASVSALELVTAPNLHRMTSGLSRFSAFGVVARCNSVQ